MDDDGTTWTPGTIRHRGHEHTYYRVGHPDDERPWVVLLHELSGLSVSLVGFANELAGRFRVLVPVLGGPRDLPDDGDRFGQMARTLLSVCVRREVHLLARNSPGTALPWLRALIDREIPAGSYGVVGMCLTGGFALALAVDERVRAAVAAQPSIPYVSCRSARAAELGIGQAAEETLRQASRPDDAGESRLRVHTLRYRGDRISPAERTETLRVLLGAGLTARRLDPPPELGRKAHSTLTSAGPVDHRDQDAVAEVIAFLAERLRPTS